MTDKVALRSVQASDKSVLFSIRSDIPTLDSLMVYPTDAATEAEFEYWLMKKLSDANTVFLSIVNDHDDCIGYVQFTNWHRKGGYAWFGIALSPDNRGQGYGTGAVDALCRHAKNQLGLRKILLEVIADNLSAITLYKRNGFLEVGKLARHYKTISGDLKDVLIMELHLQ